MNRDGRIEETVSRNDVSRGAGLFQQADCGLGDHVVRNDVAVAREKDTGLGAVEHFTGVPLGVVFNEPEAFLRQTKICATGGIESMTDCVLTGANNLAFKPRPARLKMRSLKLRWTC